MENLVNSFSVVPIPEGFVPFPIEKINSSAAELVQESYERYVDNIAIDVNGRRISYRELDRLTNQLANAIIAQVGDKEEPVAVLVEQGVSQIIAILGILKAGKIYSAMDLSNPPERLVSMLADFGARLIVSNLNNSALTRSVVDKSVSIIEMDQLNNGDEKIVNHRSASDLAGVYYTSGSTGRPKGVVYTHSGILHFARTAINLYCMNPSDKQPLPFSCSYAWSISPMFGTLICGGTLYPIDLKSTNMQDLAAFIEENSITILQLSTGMLRSFMNVLDKDNRHFPRLKALISGGEPMQSQDAQLWQTLFSQQTILGCAFASSETMLTTFNCIQHDSNLSHGILPVGFPVPHKKILIVDEERRPLPPGEVGDIAICSAYLAYGYWNKPELTDSVFQKDASDPSQRIYYSNDLGRILPNGMLEHLGRKDSYAKIRGYSVDLLEIEQAIYDLHDVKHVVVMSVPARHDPHQKQLAAYLAVNAHVSHDAVQLRKALAKKLPAYMIPSHFVFVGEMPLTLNGKVDKKALPPVDFTRELNASDLPADDIEKRLLNIWQNVLKWEYIGVNDNFFELGGDSLLAMSLFLSIEKDFLRKIPLTIILNASTIRQQAEILSSEGMKSFSPVVPVKVSGGKPPIFWIPSGFGVDLYVQGLGRHLESDQPLFLLAIPNAPKDKIIMVEELAEIYANELLKFYPNGPYYLVGHSGGGTVACATASLLLKQGRKIGWVGLLDTIPPRNSRDSIFEPFSLFFSNFFILGLLRSLKDLYRNLFVNISMRIVKIPVIQSKIIKDGRIPVVKMLGPREAAYVKTFFTHSLYSREKYQFDLIVFKANGLKRYTKKDFMANWKNYAAKGLKYVDLPGDHVSMMEEPNVAVLARKIYEEVPQD